MFYLLLVVIISINAANGVQDKTKRGYSTVNVPTVLPSKRSSEDRALVRGKSPTILASTLDGTLIAIDKRTGAVYWSLIDQPAVKSPYDPRKPVLPAFLPDPKDGTLYMMGASMKEPLKKLPFTIPELVAASPSKTADGILYSGKKIDTWFSVNRATGAKEGSLSYEGCFWGDDDVCPKMEPGNFLIGRTEYNIMMYDTTTKGRRWNVTYYDYSSNLGGIDISKDYDLAHFTDSSTGAVVTLDKDTGAVQWSSQFNSPIVAMYQIDGDSIASVPFTSVSVETLQNLIEQFKAPERDETVGETKLYPTLYVGEHEHGLFAVPSLVDEETLMISPANNGPLLLEGPRNVHVPSDVPIEVIEKKQVGVKDPQAGFSFHQEQIPKDKSSVLLFGYYQVPDYNSRSVRLSPGEPNMQLTSSQTMFPFQVDEVRVIETGQPGNQTQPATTYDRAIIADGWNKVRTLNISYIFSYELVELFSQQLIPLCRDKLSQVENKEMKFIAVFIVLLSVWFIRFVKLQFKTWEQTVGGVRSWSASSGSSSSFSTYEATATPVELDGGLVRIGNITFDPHNILGKGCEGTFVYKGRFDGRDVAVKRVLAACFSIADREVDLLRESDEHPNVVRYFCMEQCRQFRYIALELCNATLQDYVEGRYEDSKLDVTKVYLQAVQGLAYLHSLDIAHRDIKPHNVLISVPNRKGEVRAMISDFGLCKKLKVGRMSFSRRSGVAGTEGWIAPEMLIGHRSTTCMVDIFSMGCLYYYLLSKGKHPFGETFHRQANILSGKYNLDQLDEENDCLSWSLIEKMLSMEPTERPPAVAVLKHPVFWSKDKVLTFLQDVSDRVEKEEGNSALLATLERRAIVVTRGDWKDWLGSAVATDLRRHRAYNGRSVRDLLRALRNKKHHYRELSNDIKDQFGKMPGEFTAYWTKRFPRLLLHSYTALQCCKYENTFTKYYEKDYDFLQYSVRRDLTLGPNGDSRYHARDFFEPHFLGGGEKSDKSGQSSVVSEWEQLDTSSLRRVSEDLQPCVREPSQDSTSLLTRAEGRTAAAPPTVRRPVVKLEHNQPDQQLSPPTPRPTWAEAVQNIQPRTRTLSDTPPHTDTPIGQGETTQITASPSKSDACDKENVLPVGLDSVQEVKTGTGKKKKRKKHQKKSRGQSLENGTVEN